MYGENIKPITFMRIIEYQDRSFIKKRKHFSENVNVN